MLSTHAQGGDASKLLLQFASLPIFVSALFSTPVIHFTSSSTPQEALLFAWSIEHVLIATTMLTVGVFAILSWVCVMFLVPSLPLAPSLSGVRFRTLVVLARSWPLLVQRG